MALNFISGKLNLRADNSGWYLVSAYIDDSISLKTLEISQTSGATGADQFAIITGDNSLNYKLSLVRITGDGYTGINYNIDQTSTGASAHPRFAITGNDNNAYYLDLISGDSVIDYTLTLSGSGSTGSGSGSSPSGTSGLLGNMWRGRVIDSVVQIMSYNPVLVAR